MDFGTANHIYIENCYIHDVGNTTFAAPIKIANGATFGDTWANGCWSQPDHTIVFKALRGSANVPTRFNDIKIEGNTLVGNNDFGNLITFASEWGEFSDNESPLLGHFYGSINISIKNNDISHCRAGSIQPKVWDGSVGNGTVVECNLIHDIGTCNGMYTECVKNVKIQYNEICRNSFSKSAGDMCGVDVDNGTCNSIVQYNYIHDMADAMFEIVNLGINDFMQLEHYTKDNIIRYNISQNNKGLRSKVGNSQNGSTFAKFICFNGGIMTGNKIYNNTHYSSSEITAPYVVKIMQKPVPDNYVYNNIFFNNGAKTSIFETTDMKFDYNCYYGYETTPGGEHSIPQTH